MAERNTNILRTTVDVEAWRRALLSRRPNRALPDVRFELDFLSNEENDSGSALAGRLKRRCGCEAGGIAGALAVFASLSIFAIPMTRPILSWPAVGATLAVVVAVSITAKLCALAWTRLALIRLASALIHAPRGGSYGTRLQ